MFLMGDIKDMSGVDSENMIAYLPLAAIDLKPPPDGYPCIGDFTTTCLSFLFSGSRLHREPLDVALTKTPDGTHTFTLKNGFTRLKLEEIDQHFVFVCWCIVPSCLFWQNCGLRTAPLLLLMIASDLDPIAGKDIGTQKENPYNKCFLFVVQQELILPLLAAIGGMCNLPCTISKTGDTETHSFENIQLSCQGAERQRKDVTGLLLFVFSQQGYTGNPSARIHQLVCV